MKQRTIVITGASSGIGKASAELLSQNKDNTILLVARSRDKMEQIAENKKNCIVYECDLKNMDNVIEVSRKIIEDYPEPDVLVNNAGVGFPSELDSLQEEDYDTMMNTNVKGLVFFTRTILKTMKETNHGHIINISSSAGITANPVAPIYCTSKFALEGYTDGLRKQINRDGKNIRVTLVRPGGVDTNYWGKREIDRTKFMTPEEMALVVKFVLDFPEKSNVMEIMMESVR